MLTQKAGKSEMARRLGITPQEFQRVAELNVTKIDMPARVPALPGRRLEVRPA
ncbi:hypothetical protein [Neisseria basseii]|uniref:hypothetical protein n=1 Tax=Neisseria basseii TaxID=2830650 RepID=UPI00265939EC|nr:hypothetical protein [Neisseria basseii]